MHSPTARSGSYRYAGYQSRLTAAAALSLLVHAVMLSLQFGLPGLGLPDLELPWNQRRAPLPGLSVVLSNASRAPEPASPAQMPPQPAAIRPDTSSDRAPPQNAEAPRESAPVGHASVRLGPAKTPARQRRRTAATQHSPIENADASPAAQRSAARPEQAPAGSGTHIITKDDTGQSAFAVPPTVLDEPGQTMAPKTDVQTEPAQPPVQKAATPPVPDEPAAQDQEQARIAAQMLAEQETALRAREAEERAREEQRVAQELEARRQAEALALQARQKREEEEHARRMQEQEAQRQEEQRRQDEARAQRLAREMEVQRQAEEAAKQAAALALQKQVEQKRLEEEHARRALEAEARRRDELRLQEEAKARREAMELEARRQAEEEARRQAARQKQAEEAAARERTEAETRRQAEAAARQREQALAEKRAAEAAAMSRNAAGGNLAARAMELARKPDDLSAVPPAPHPLPQAADPARRRSVLGRIDNDVGLAMYVESWRLKIERNGRLNYKQSLVESSYTEPIVTVAVRSDGSIEDILFHRSSGRPELDEAVRRIIRINARYAAFPPELARRYDVIEIRRVWNFDGQLKLLEEVR